MQRSIVRALALAGLCAALAAAPPALARNCKPPVIGGVAYGAKVNPTRVEARNNWAKIVGQQRGSQWSLWSKSKYRKLHCRKVGKGDRKWKCNATAVPCYLQR